jgi:hypothetical protein
MMKLFENYLHIFIILQNVLEVSRQCHKYCYYIEVSTLLRIGRMFHYRSNGSVFSKLRRERMKLVENVINTAIILKLVDNVIYTAFILKLVDNVKNILYTVYIIYYKIYIIKLYRYYLLQMLFYCMIYILLIMKWNCWVELSCHISSLSRALLVYFNLHFLLKFK